MTDAEFREQVRREALAQGLPADLADLLAERVGKDETPAAVKPLCSDTRELVALLDVCGHRSMADEFIRQRIGFQEARALIRSCGRSEGRGLRLVGKLTYRRANQP